jgi:acyl-CoA synthetase (AMP-forming)/AMP-acid ligase II
MVGYSMTEAFTMIVNRVDTESLPDGASGRRYDDFDVQVVDDEGDECPPGVAGEVIVRPQQPGIMFDGYWRRPAATIAVTRDLWFHTGDLGKRDEEGYFYFVDRKRDYPRRGGQNISGFEGAAVFLRHEAIAEVAVHAVKSDLSEARSSWLRRSRKAHPFPRRNYAAGAKPRFPSLPCRGTWKSESRFCVRRPTGSRSSFSRSKVSRLQLGAG